VIENDVILIWYKLYKQYQGKSNGYVQLMKRVRPMPRPIGLFESMNGKRCV